MTVHGCTVRSPLTGCQVTSRSRDRFSRYLKYPDTFRTGLLLYHCKCESHSKQVTQRRLTADRLAPRKNDGSRVDSKASSDWLPSYIKATGLVLEKFKISGYFPDRPPMFHLKLPFIEWTQAHVFRNYVIMSLINYQFCWHHTWYLLTAINVKSLINI
jgi:hypothetical protein